MFDVKVVARGDGRASFSLSYNEEKFPIFEEEEEEKKNIRLRQKYWRARKRHASTTARNAKRVVRSRIARVECTITLSVCV
jgi:hypothetical protein